MPSKVLFIVNPISGTGKQKLIATLLEQHLNQELYIPEIVFTEYRGHAINISKEAAGKYPFVIAVGGDGTVNEVATGLINSTSIMGILPIGSGNGLARHLNLPMDTTEAIKVLNRAKSKNIDTASINGQPFVNVAGLGFDAHIAHLFACEKKRGPLPYVKLATNEFQKYKPKHYEITIEGKTYTKEAFLISFANSSQFGNNAYISPHALIDDGLLDVCIMSEFPKVEAAQLAVKLFNKRLDKSRYMKIIRGTKMQVVTTEPIKAHMDGEPVNFPNKINIEINPSSLHIIYNESVPVIAMIETEFKRALQIPKEKLRKHLV